jgi:predicted transcriptional regulator
MEVGREPSLGQLLARALALRGRNETWLAKRCGVSQPAVNQWLNNKTIPKKLQLAHAIIALDFAVGVHEAARAAGYQVEDIQEIIQEIIATVAVPHDDIEHAKKRVQNIYKTRITGNATLAIEEVDELVWWLEGKEKKAYGTSLYPQLLSTHANALVEKSLAYTELLYPREMWDAVEPIAQEIDRLAKECEKVTVQI